MKLFRETATAVFPPNWLPLADADKAFADACMQMMTPNGKKMPKSMQVKYHAEAVEALAHRWEACKVSLGVDHPLATKAAEELTKMRAIAP